MKSKARLEAFSDGVIAIIITIMVLELPEPEGADWAALAPVTPVLLTYVLSFVTLGIYWNNHHHLLHAVHRLTAGLMWANLHLLFWLSLIPFVTAWMGHYHSSSVPTAAYGVVMLMCGASYWLLQRAILRGDGNDSLLAKAIGSDVKGHVSPIVYLVAIPLAFVNQWLSDALYVAVALWWLIPDRRIQLALERRAHEEAR
jgi:uncharacterized membrane protein